MVIALYVRVSNEILIQISFSNKSRIILFYYYAHTICFPCSCHVKPESRRFDECKLKILANIDFKFGNKGFGL